MEPTDPNEPTESSAPPEMPDHETWAQTSAWAPTLPPSAVPPTVPPALPPTVPPPSYVAVPPADAPPPSYVPQPGYADGPQVWNPPPPAVAEPPSPADYAPPTPEAIPGVKVRRRIGGGGSIVLWAVIAEIVIVAAAGNQWVTKSVDDWVDRRLNRNSDLLGQFVASSRVYDWRFTPAAHDVIDAWPAELAMIAVVFAVTAAALHVLTRDGVSAGRAFLSALLTVVFASVVGAIISGLIVRSLSATYYGYVGASALRPHPSLSDRVTNAFFGPGLSGYTVVGSVALGLLVGIVAALVARRASGDVDPRLAQVRGPAPAAAYGVGAPVAPAVWTPPPPATPPSAFDVGRHSRPD